MTTLEWQSRNESKTPVPRCCSCWMKCDSRLKKSRPREQTSTRKRTDVLDAERLQFPHQIEVARQLEDHFRTLDLAAGRSARQRFVADHFARVEFHHRLENGRDRLFANGANQPLAQGVVVTRLAPLGDVFRFAHGVVEDARREDRLRMRRRAAAEDRHFIDDRRIDIDRFQRRARGPLEVLRRRLRISLQAGAKQ